MQTNLRIKNEDIKKYTLCFTIRLNKQGHSIQLRVTFIHKEQVLTPL